jgi:hypothetical protein
LGLRASTTTSLRGGPPEQPAQELDLVLVFAGPGCESPSTAIDPYGMRTGPLKTRPPGRSGWRPCESVLQGGSGLHAAPEPSKQAPEPLNRTEHDGVEDDGAVRAAFREEVDVSHGVQAGGGR